MLLQLCFWLSVNALLIENNCRVISHYDLIVTRSQLVTKYAAQAQCVGTAVVEHMRAAACTVRFACTDTASMRLAVLC